MPNSSPELRPRRGCLDPAMRGQIRPSPVLASVPKPDFVAPVALQSRAASLSQSSSSAESPHYKGGLPPRGGSPSIAVANHDNVKAMRIDICEKLCSKVPDDIAPVTTLIRSCKKSLKYLHLCLRSSMAYYSSLFTSLLRSLDGLTHLSLQGCLLTDHAVRSVAALLLNTWILQRRRRHVTMRHQKIQTQIPSQSPEDSTVDDSVVCLAHKVRRINIAKFDGGRPLDKMLARFLLSRAAALEEFTVTLADRVHPQQDEYDEDYKKSKVLAWPRAFHRTASARAGSALTALLAGAAGGGAIVLPLRLRVRLPTMDASAKSLQLPPSDLAVDSFARFFFDFSLMYVGAGMICSHLVNLSLLFGVVLSWDVMWPLMSKQEGKWYSAKASASSMTGLYGYKVFLCIALLIGDGFYNFLKVILVTLKSIHEKSQRGRLNRVADEDSVAIDDLQRNEVFNRDNIPAWVAYAGYALLSAVAVMAIPLMFREVKWYFVVIAYLLAPALGFCNAYGTGLTDMNMGYNYGKVALFVFAAWAGKDNGVVAGLVTCGLVKQLVLVSADLMHDFKTAHLTLTSPQSMVVGQAVGTLMGCVVAPLTFFLFYEAFDVGNPDG
ncbi:hypothetical protein ZWY2020_012734 [Hordeum vulgare]|nr:hypothetical protein ZWY2020_012734 [Hordeum vulgare]